MQNQAKIAVITYNTPHRKTQDVVGQLKIKGYRNVKLFALPFVNRPNPFSPIFQHRPSKAIDIMPEKMVENLEYEFQTVLAESLSDDLKTYAPDFILVAGAGLLPDELVENHKIINTHPGWLPKVRGLDSLKWAIHNKEIIGITSHFIDTEADAGFLIEQREIPVYENDTFHSVAFRQYETEIEMLVYAIELVAEKTDFPSLSNEAYLPTRRMPKNIEENLMQDFENYKIKKATK